MFTFIHSHSRTCSHTNSGGNTIPRPTHTLRICYSGLETSCTKTINVQPGHFHIHLELMVSLTKRDELCRYRSCCPRQCLWHYVCINFTSCSANPGQHVSNWSSKQVTNLWVTQLGGGVGWKPSFIIIEQRQ